MNAIQPLTSFRVNSKEPPMKMNATLDPRAAMRSLGTVRDGPHDGPQDAPAVQREAWNEVEQRERHVDIGEPAEDGRNAGQRDARCGKSGDASNQPTPHANDEACGRAGNRDPEFFAGCGGVLLDLCDAAEREEGNAANGNAAEPRDARVRELVQDDADEKETQ